MVPITLARELKAELQATPARADVLTGEVRTLELELAATWGKLEGQQKLAADLCNHLVPPTSSAMTAAPRNNWKGACQNLV